MDSTVHLLGGVVVAVNNSDLNYQEMLEIKLLNGEIIILTARPGGGFRIGKKIDKMIAFSSPE